ncbi:unnamed protein product [Clavelina lepadiformis]|uniref:Uncharacterized protein n=1 Tax=Clavelina lepadiformis TaxID=159417 RepID=A0ABP0G151_CLALP
MFSKNKSIAYILCDLLVCPYISVKSVRSPKMTTEYPQTRDLNWTTGNRKVPRIRIIYEKGFMLKFGCVNNCAKPARAFQQLLER